MFLQKCNRIAKGRYGERTFSNEASFAKNFASKDAFWSNKKNQRAYLDRLSSQLKITQQHDWYQVRASDFVNRAGQRLLAVNHWNVHNCLQRAYPGMLLHL
jgi:hypothetical protein